MGVADIDTASRSSEITVSPSYSEKQSRAVSSNNSMRSQTDVGREDPSMRPGKETEKRVEENDEAGSSDEEEGEQGARNDMERVASRRSGNSISTVPNGGLTAWLQVFGAFFLFINSWGIINTYGAYQTYYETELLTDSTPSAISWVGSIQAFLLLMVGALSGPIYDAGYFRHLLLGGSFLLVFGTMMLSLCTQYWQVLLAQAICIGTGTGMLFVPSVAILSSYFTTRIATAVGLAASGSSIGGLIYPIVFQELLPKLGFPWTVRVIGFLILVTLLVPILVMRVRVLPSSKRQLLDLAAFKIPAYALDVFGFFVGFIGLYMPFFYAQIYALDHRLTSPDLAFYLLAIMNSTSTFGRILPNFLADRIGPFNVVIPCAFASGILCFCFAAVTSSAGMIIVMAFYGFFSGTFVSMPPTLIMHLSQDARSKIGTRLGQNFACLSVGILIGTPIGGAILERSGYTHVWAFGGSMILAGGCILVSARVAFKGWGLMVKA
ncbi:MFS general substrate transporter [Sporormia fimetaria CBS 119925]|uniref:MFS general substrate transporter n=1 Tax=Sporormia fimetaria CBS 119925 TaxID=1340428 RepID=A0A6A6VE61_9PLEO|nr:MFS general substrate transporter [Sporormia fimetaria CBS 119925]